MEIIQRSVREREVGGIDDFDDRATFWSVTKSLLGADQATIPHLKEENLSYVWIKKIQIFQIDS